MAETVHTLSVTMCEWGERAGIHCSDEVVPHLPTVTLMRKVDLVSSPIGGVLGNQHAVGLELLNWM